MHQELFVDHAVDLGVADEVIVEPEGGAHRDAEATARDLGDAIGNHLDELRQMTPDALREDRYRRFRALGQFEEQARARLADENAPDAVLVLGAAGVSLLVAALQQRTLVEWRRIAARGLALAGSGSQAPARGERQR